MVLAVAVCTEGQQWERNIYARLAPQEVWSDWAGGRDPTPSRVPQRRGTTSRERQLRTAGWEKHCADGPAGGVGRRWRRLICSRDWSAWCRLARASGRRSTPR
jgi:hypothetical protein